MTLQFSITFLPMDSYYYANISEFIALLTVTVQYGIYFSAWQYMFSLQALAFYSKC